MALATAPIFRRPKPSADHSSASALASSARDGLPNGAVVVGSRVVVAALADGPEEDDHLVVGRLEVAPSVAHGRQRGAP